MGHYVLSDLSSQQKTLSASDYDLRVTNLARFIYRRLPTKKGRFIDIGAGNGLLLRFFKKKGFDVSGMELSADLCEAMKQNPAMKGIHILQGDISKKRGPQEYDVVLASDVIEHIKNDERALSNLFSFVAPGGILILSIPAHSFLFGKRDKLWGHYRRYDKDRLLKKLSQLRGQIEFISYWNFVGFFAYFFYEKVLGKPIREDFRYKKSLTSRITRAFLGLTLRLEEFLGYFPVGLTLVAGIKKNK